MNRALLFLLTLGVLFLFGSTAAQAADCPVYANNVATGTSGDCGADLNGDGLIDEADAGIMESAMQTGDLSGDLDGSGTVTVTDYNLFINMKMNPSGD